MFNSTKLVLTNTMMIGVIMTICSNNWMTMWMGLEMSLLSFIPFMSSNKISSEAMIKYFIMQSVASTMFLFGMIYMLIGVNMMNEMVLTTAMLIKLGSAPFHNWVILMVETIEYLPMFLILTLMKIQPLFIMYQINSSVLMIPIVLSMTISSISCLNQSSIRKTLGYSSIFNISLILTSVDKFNISMMYLLLYSSSMMMLMIILTNLKVKFINQITSNDFSVWMKINMWINMLSMSGFPPTMGFIAKLMVIQNLIMNEQITLTAIMIVTSMFVMMFYSRLAFTCMLNSLSFKKWMLIKSKPLFFILMMNLLMPLLMLTTMSLC